MIQVRAPGLFTTVQDLGRPGYGPLGVSASGAADPVALRIGNLLVGNAPGAAALEMTLLGGTFVFEVDAVVSLTGSDFQANLETWTPNLIRAGHEVKVGPTQSGARCYLCMRGGVSVPLFLGSASTHILSGLGGLEGRALRKGDVLRIGDSAGAYRPARVNPEVLAKLAPRKLLRVTAGTQWDWFNNRDTFLGGLYRVSEESNRMGLRLEGSPLEATGRGQMITEGVPLGAIQIPAGGQPIILFVEQQTTGGYPKIANVISADLASVGQLRPRDEIHFQLVSLAEARRLIQEQEADLRRAVVRDDL
jgi:antagonist of KipI